MTEPRRKQASRYTLWLSVGWFVCVLIVFVGAMWMWDFIDDIIRDALEARFESKPTEGFAYWYWQEVKSSLVAVVLLMIPFPIALAWLLRIAIRWSRNSTKNADKTAS
jgi:ABC-type multidrug transport system fused ATPase/permease subunit